MDKVRYIIDYNKVKYCSDNNYIYEELSNSIDKYYLKSKEETFDQKLTINFKFSKKNNKICLSIFYLTAHVINLKLDSVTQDLISDLIFDLNSLEGEISSENFYELLKYSNKNKININPYELYEICLYLSDILKTNKNIETYIMNNHFLKNNERYLFNILKLFTLNLSECEKLITSGNDDLFLNFVKDSELSLDKGKKLNQVIGFPKFALDIIKEYNLELKTIQDICNEFNANTLKIIFELIEHFSNFNKYNKIRFKYEMEHYGDKFISDIYSLMKDGYKITDLLNYILKQRMYWSKNSSFNIPFNELGMLYDYNNIAKENNILIEKYPQNLNKMHDILLKNITSLKDKKTCEKFEEVVKNYHDKDIIVDDYVFTAPIKAKSLIDEGNNLHHCISSFANKVIVGESEIYFMRNKKFPEIPFVTIEICPFKKKIIEFKGDYNIEPTDKNILKAINEFEKIKKL